MSEQVTPEETEITLVGLDGFTENFGELSQCSLIFHFSNPKGHKYHLSLKGVVTSLKFAEKQRLIAPLPDGWWQDLGNIDGCGIQTAPGETNDLSDR